MCTQLIQDKRVCSNCGSNETYLRKTRNGKPYGDWRRDGHGGWLCGRCHSRLVVNPKWNPIWNPITNKKFHLRRLLFRDKTILLDKNPRTGKCSKCDKKIGDEYINYLGQVAIMKKTDTHHDEYHDDEPLKDTRELCVSCHKKESARLRRLKKDE